MKPFHSKSVHALLPRANPPRTEISGRKGVVFFRVHFDDTFAHLTREEVRGPLAPDRTRNQRAGAVEERARDFELGIDDVNGSVPTNATYLESFSGYRTSDGLSGFDYWPYQTVMISKLNRRDRQIPV